jgi:hypothetical protein
MPLDTRKAAHLQAVTQKTFQGRQQTVTFVYQSGSVYQYVALAVIFRPLESIDPQIPTTTGSAPRPRSDLLMIAPAATNCTGVLFIADTATATAEAVQAAVKYQIIAAFPIGLLPGGTRMQALLRRLR